MSARAQMPSRSGTRVAEFAYYARVLRVIAGAEFKLKYAGSFLGYIWSLAKPLTLFSVLYVVFGRFFKFNLGVEHYPLYLLIGIVLWTFFADAIALTLPSVVIRGPLLRRIAFPRIIVPASVIISAMITFCVDLVAIAAFVAWNRLTPELDWLLLLPLFVELALFVLGLGLILATLYVRLRDIDQIWVIVSQLLFYASPIFYPVELLPGWAQRVTFLNPFVQVMQDVRSILIPSDEIVTPQDVFHSSGGRLLPVAIAASTLLLGFFLFSRDAPWMAERV
jgi:ABC-2 type transport system permease protein